MSLDYSAYDFDSVVQQLQNKLALKETWKDTYRSSAGQMLIELFAYLADLDGYILERRAEETYKDFARLLSSVRALAGLVGYEPRRKVSSVSTERFSSSSPPVTIPKGTVVQTAGAVQFVTTQEGTIFGAYVDIPIKQGVPNDRTETSDGTANQSFEIPPAADDVEDVENSSVVVSVNSIPWTKVNTFIGQSSTAQVYKITTKATQLVIEFGDGVNGLIPPNTQEIKIEWLESLGANGNVSGTGTITQIVSPSLPGVTATNTEAAVGGEDEEGIEEIRVNAPLVFATGDRAVTKQDYKALLLAYPGVDKAEVYGEQDVLSGVSNPDYAWRVEIVIVPSGGGTIGTALQNQIEAYLESKAPITTWITFKDPTYIPVDFIIQAISDPIYNSNDVAVLIGTALDALLSPQVVELGDFLRYSDVVAAVDGVVGVENHLTSVYLVKIGGTGNASKTVFASGDAGIGVIPVNPIDRGNVLVYLEESGVLRRVGYDNGSGSFTSDANTPSPRVTGGSVNYSTGAFSITFDAPPASGDEVRIRYQTGMPDEKNIGVGNGVLKSFTGVINRYISRSTVEVYREGILVATDDGAGSLVDAGGGEVSGGSVNYDTGDITVNFAIAPLTDNNITAEYYYENQDIKVSLDKLLQMGEKDITVEPSS